MERTLRQTVLAAVVFLLTACANGVLEHPLMGEIQDGSIPKGTQWRLTGCIGHPFETEGDSLFHVVVFKDVIPGLDSLRNKLSGGAPNYKREARVIVVGVWEAYEVRRNAERKEMSRKLIPCDNPLSVVATEGVLRKACKRRQEEDRRRAK